MKIWHISDTHLLHTKIKEIPNVDVVFHTGDAANSKIPAFNNNEVLNFIDWFKDLPIPTKIFVAGNHDTSIATRMVTKDQFEENDIIYLEDSGITIDDIHIWGSPYTPTFGQWVFMKRRDRMHNHWKQIPENTDVLLLHGPPKGIRDLSYDRSGKLEMCGDRALTNRVFKMENLKLVCFGHIHNVDDIFNQGVSTYGNTKTIFSNAACVTDKVWGRLTSFGNIIDL